MNAELAGDIVIVRNGNTAKIHEKSHYGNQTEDGLQLSIIEALYLMEKGNHLPIGITQPCGPYF